MVDFEREKKGVHDVLINREWRRRFGNYENPPNTTIFPRDDSPTPKGKRPARRDEVLKGLSL